MARKKSGGGWGWLLGITVGAIALYYLEAGRGPEENAAALPDKLENQIDFVVAALNKRFGKKWVSLGLDILQRSLAQILPPEIVALVSVIYHVEFLSEREFMNGDQKKSRAIELVAGWNSPPSFGIQR